MRRERICSGIHRLVYESGICLFLSICSVRFCFIFLFLSSFCETQWFMFHGQRERIKSWTQFLKGFACLFVPHTTSRAAASVRDAGNVCHSLYEGMNEFDVVVFSSAAKDATNELCLSQCRSSGEI